MTNEPNFDEEVLIEKMQEPVGVKANSGADSGLDKVCPLASGDAGTPKQRGPLGTGGEGQGKRGDRGFPIGWVKSSISNLETQPSRFKPENPGPHFGRSACRRGRRSRVVPGEEEVGTRNGAGQTEKGTEGAQA